jgi:hypothetical protein
MGVGEERRRLELPDRRKNTYKLLEQRLDEHFGYLQALLTKWIKRGLIAYAIVAVACALALLGYGIILKEIQHQRHQVCTNQNERHDRSLRLFEVAAAQLAREHPEQADQIRENREFNIRIINSLAPRQNCDKVAPERGLLP